MEEIEFLNFGARFVTFFAFIACFTSQKLLHVHIYVYNLTKIRLLFSLFMEKMFPYMYYIHIIGFELQIPRNITGA
jgi:hypothetical protein